MDKRRTSSNAKSGRKYKTRKACHVMVKYSGPSYSDLPRNILESILLRLSVKRIIICKCVCKTWYNVMSDPGFAKLHLHQAQVYPLIQTSGFTVLSRMLYLVQLEFEDFELKLDCNHRSQELNLECGCNVKVKLDTKFPLPLRNLPPLCDSYKYGMLSIGVLEGELCVFSTFLYDCMEIWVMKDCNGEKDWSKALAIGMDRNERWPSGPYQPIKYLNNGALLMYNCTKRAFVYHNPKTPGFRYLKIRGMQSNVDAISYVPSFVSLKDVASGSDTTVQNVRSRCGELKLHKEGKGVSIVEIDSQLGE